MFVHLLRRGLRDRAGGAVVRAQAAADAAQAAGRLERQTVVGAVVRIAGHGDLGRGVGGDAGRELGAEPFDLRAVGCVRPAAMSVLTECGAMTSAAAITRKPSGVSVSRISSRASSTARLPNTATSTAGVSVPRRARMRARHGPGTRPP